MTVHEARIELSRPPVFGDAKQIEALNILRKVQDCKEAILNCEEEHLSSGLPEQSMRLAIQSCSCMEPWVPEMWGKRGDWDIVNAAMRECGI